MGLREELLKAGLISKEQAQSAEQLASAKNRTNKGQAKDGKPPRPSESAPTAPRPMSAAEHAEALSRVDALMDQHRASQDRGGRRWYFLLRDGRVRHLEVSERMAGEIENGTWAIVEGSEGRVGLVDGKGAQDIAAVDASAVRCWNGR